MISLLLAAMTCPVLPCSSTGAPAHITVATARGEFVIPVSVERGHPVLPASRLQTSLPMVSDVSEGWATVLLAEQPFRFLLGAPAFTYRGRLIPLAGGAYVLRDTLFLPLQWLTGHVPRIFQEAYRYDPYAARFEEASFAPVVTRVSSRAIRTAPPPPAASVLPPSGALRRAHTVVVDPGHGGADQGNPGLHFPRGVKEKHVTLALAKLLRTELRRRGVEVIMTRTTDSLVDLHDRGSLCRESCDLFASIHVNSLGRHVRRYQQVGGFETYFLSEARTAEARRVAAMENEALRYETTFGPAVDDPLGFILKDLQTNEYLRESALLADLIQRHGARAHPGKDRGVSQAGFMVLTTARRPAVLVETGFSTNRRDARFLAGRMGQSKLASAIADGIVAYLREYESKVAAGISP